MQLDERVVTISLLIALVALVIAKWRSSDGTARIPSTRLNYNQPVWSLEAPFANVLPNAAASLAGVSLSTAAWEGGSY